MCGIAGIINLKGGLRGLPVHVKKMTDALRHRGPDGEGFLFLCGDEVITAYGNDTPQAVISSACPYAPVRSITTVPDENFHFALGHRRLSIIDVSPAGHQPLCDATQKAWLIFNGEVYNYIELRDELKQAGIPFESGTDSEVILKSYLHWGEDCVKRFNGMWAFVIYDSRKNTLFGSRDRAGVKPFYYYMDSTVFAFASEQKALLKLPFVKTEIRFAAASAFLAGDIQYIERGEENMFRNIFEVMPAHNFRINLADGSFHKWNYYSLKANTKSSSFDETKFDSFRDETEKRLVNSVKLRLRSDVPVGSCLSGGIDSSAIVSIMGKLVSSGEKVNLGGKLNVFTLQFNDRSIDESRWAAYVVKQTNAEWNLVKPSAQELLNDLSDLNYAQDIPVCSTGTYGQFRLMRSAKEKGIKVILDGQGGDELFGGYMTHSIVLWRELLRKMKLANAISEMSCNGKFLFNAKHLFKDLVKRKFVSWMPISAQAGAYRSYFLQNEFLERGVIEEYFRSGSARAELEVNNSSSLNDALLRDFVNARLKMYLKYEDRSSMWHSIEARTPFADDHLLAEYVFGLPGSYKIYRGINKYLLREAVSRYLPAEIRNRMDKLGFVTPIDQWLRQTQNECLDLLDNSVQGFMDVKKIKSNPDRFFSMRNHADGVRIFRMISFAVWKKKFNL